MRSSECDQFIDFKTFTSLQYAPGNESTLRYTNQIELSVFKQRITLELLTPTSYLMRNFRKDASNNSEVNFNALHITTLRKEPSVVDKALDSVTIIVIAMAYCYWINAFMG